MRLERARTAAPGIPSISTDRESPRSSTDAGSQYRRVPIARLSGAQVNFTNSMFYKGIEAQRTKMEDSSYGFPPEQFPAETQEVLSHYFTNSDKNTFVLINLPEVVKGAMFSRYSRSAKSARRIFLDEFLQNKDLSLSLHQVSAGESPVAASSAEAFYDRVLVGYGDDSVAELAGAHVACENVSSLVGDILTDSRIGISPLEKSARYVMFDKKVGGKFLYMREPRIMESRFENEYVQMMDLLFEKYSEWIRIVLDDIRGRSPQTDASDRAYDSATRAKACDVLKNVLPAARLTNVGLHGNGRAFEYLIAKLYSSPLTEARLRGGEIHEELRLVLPSFVKKSEERSRYLAVARGVRRLSGTHHQKDGGTFEPVALIDHDRDALTSVLSAMMFRESQSSLVRLHDIAKSMSPDEKRELIAAYFGARANRRDSPEEPSRMPISPSNSAPTTVRSEICIDIESLPASGSS